MPDSTGRTAGEAERIQQRIDRLTRNRDAIHAYLAAVHRQDGVPEQDGTPDA
ncbi:hypothetical protein [Microtetraspora niveoalba]|uniref:hypothetical protein n=1 Tax=Microtetraspora niveoalba TaxID=46175 RepID=UPI0012FC5AA3|nr:hypothetical protein [Microtetraspora niveoalba]